MSNTRARRILPAALVVIAAVTLAAALLWRKPRALAAGLDAFASLTFVENWHLIATRTAYLQGDDGESPLEHFWSLGVEERFFDFWPLLLIAAGLGSRRLRRRGSARLARALTPTLIGSVLVVSLAFAAWQSTVDQNAAYFDTRTRTWELAAGALAATLAPLVARVPLRLRLLLTIAGLAGLAVSLAAPVAPRHYPWPVAVVPVASAVLLLACPAQPGTRLARVLDNRPLRLTGRISYSLYLWHFPVIVFTRSLLGDSPSSTLIAIPLSVLLSVLSYRFVERPVLVRSRGRSASRPLTPRRLVQAATATVVLITLGTSTGAQTTGASALTSVESAAGATGLLGAREPSTSPIDPAAAQRLVTAALSRSSWPATTPRLKAAFDNQ